MKNTLIIGCLLIATLSAYSSVIIQIDGIDNTYKGNTNTAVVKYCSISGKVRVLMNKIYITKNSNYSEDFKNNKLDDYLDRTYGGEIERINKQLEEVGITNQVNNINNICNQIKELENIFLLRIKADYGMGDLTYHKMIQITPSGNFAEIKNNTFLVLKIRNSYTHRWKEYTSADQHYKDKIDENALQGYSSMYVYDRTDRFVSNHTEERTEDLVIQPFQCRSVTR